MGTVIAEVSNVQQLESNAVSGKVTLSNDQIDQIK